ncbi:MAG: hypothetical protein MZV70_32245 [Desulfobacterales bacterium]|nr:hypothetical protein [Desulfobacterales bacterium]
MCKERFIVLRYLLLPLFFFIAVCTGAFAAIIPVTKFRSAEMPGGAPAGWVVEKKLVRRR